MDQIGRYRIIGELGRGAMGVVYHATDPSIGRSVAIKTIRILDINDTQQRNRLRERLFREARSAGVLSHPNIVTIYDMDEVDGLAYIAMAYVNGPTLEKILASESAISGAKMLRILRQAASALDYAHSKGIVHRDVKPANIMTDEDGSVKITDFGIAKIAEGAHATDTRTVAGTPNYMSPEQVQGMPVDGRSDQFSLAVIAYEILTGERPFVGEHLSTIVFKIVAEEPPSAPRLNNTLTEQIDSVLRKGLAKKPEDRYATCSNFVGALEMACAESRGWKTLPAGTASNLPTLAVDSARELGAPPPAFAAPPAASASASASFYEEKPRRSNWLLPLLLSILLVAGVGLVFVYQSGLIGGPSDTTQAEESKPPETQPQQTLAEKQPPPDIPPAEAKPPDDSGSSTPADSTPGQADQPAGQTTAQTAPTQTSPVQTTPAQEPAPPVEKPKPAPPPEIAKKPSPLKSPTANEPAHEEEAPRTRIVPEPRSGRLQDIWVTTSPPGAKAVLDGNVAQSCVTPCMLHGAAGLHHLAVVQPGFSPEYRDVQVGDTAVDLPQIALQQPTGMLFISSDPPGARIWVNGQPISQVTPTELRLPPKTYSIRVEKNGVSATKTVPLTDSIVRLGFSLNQ